MGSSGRLVEAKSWAGPGSWMRWICAFVTVNINTVSGHGNLAADSPLNPGCAISQPDISGDQHTRSFIHVPTSPPTPSISVAAETTHARFVSRFTALLSHIADTSRLPEVMSLPRSAV
jgi:hypothetical protein